MEAVPVIFGSKLTKMSLCWMDQGKIRERSDKGCTVQWLFGAERADHGGTDGVGVGDASR